MNRTMEVNDYAPSYQPDQIEEYIAAFYRDGYVVIDNVLNTHEIANSIDEIWTYLEKDGLVKRNDRSTWGNENWPSEVCTNGGFMGKFPYWKRMKKLDSTFVNKQTQAWNNRLHPLVYNIFANIMNTKRLWVSIDRYGVMRPAKTQGNNANAINENEVINEAWQTKKEWLHWDLSPFHYGTSAAGYAPASIDDKARNEYGSLRVQGLIALSACPEQTGGFHCVPGFTNERFFNWAKEHKDSYGILPEISSRNFIEVPENDSMRNEIRRIPIRAGSLLIWNSQLPHGNFPNTGTEFRMVQYIKMIPVDDPREFQPAMRLQKFNRKEWFPEKFVLSELGEKLLGLREW